MKKIIAAVLALTTVLGVCTGCGKKSATDDGSSKASVSRDKDSESSAADKDDDKDDKKADKKDEVKRAALSDEQCLDAMNSFIDAASDSDFDELMRLCVPDSTFKPMKEIGMFDELFDSIAGDMSDLPSKVNVTSVREPEENELRASELLYTIFDTFFNKMTELGITYEMVTGEEEIPDDLKDQLTDAFSMYSEIYDLENCDIEPTIRFESYAVATFEMDGDEIELPVFKIAGEDDLKLDAVFYPTMLGYVKKSKDVSANTDAKTLFTSSSASVIEMDEEGKTFEGDALICSDESKNYFSSANDEKLAEEFYRTLGAYIEVGEFKPYFIVISKGTCVYAALDKNGTAGTYPASSQLTNDDGTITFEGFDDKKTYDELYKIAMDVLK